MIRMLIVDDEIDVCDFVKHFFEERNFQVFTALNGSDALRIVRKDKPQLVTLAKRNVMIKQIKERLFLFAYFAISLGLMFSFIKDTGSLPIICYAFVAVFKIVNFTQHITKFW